MSLYFNDTTNLKGIIQVYEKECGFDYGYISGDETRRKAFTVDANLAMDDYLSIGFQESNTWQLDDTNHPKYPIIKANLVSGQRDYPFTADGDGNLILDIYKVLVADSNGLKRPIDPVMEQDETGFTDGQDVTGIPSKYGKLANGIFLDPIPNYNSEGGIEVYINREGSYFVHTDTTKMPGVPGLHHRYFALKPAKDYARRHLSNDAYTKISNEVNELEREIKKYFNKRNKDEKTIFTMKRINFR